MNKQNILVLALKPAMRMTKFHFGGAIIVMMLAVGLVAASAAPASGGPTATPLVTGLQGAMGSTIGPDGALYVTEGAVGRISRVDPQTGEKTTFASGLPKSIIGIGGAIDVAFIDNIAYVLVTLVSDPFLFPSSDVDGIYRVDGPNSFTVVADIGQFNLDNPPTMSFDYFIHTGLQYALQSYGGGFLVTDAHLNRVLRVTLDGEITVLIPFGNIVPTGLEVRGNTVYMAEAGPDPHVLTAGKVVSFAPKSPTATEVASGAPFLLDVEFGGGGRLYALSHGVTSLGDPSNALPNTGALFKVNVDGTFTVITDSLDRPTSLDFIGNTAYVVTLTGDILKIDGVSK